MVKNSTENKVFDDNQIKFQAYGVKIGVRAERKVYLKRVFQRLEKVFPNGLETVDEREIEYRFFIKSKKKGGYELFRNDEKMTEGADRENFFDSAETIIRLTVAEFAVGKVFLHAGVVGWKGKAIVIPGQSFAGKSTLVAELVKKGALYYSDEYAVLDEEGNVEPFPKWLSLRGIIDRWTQLDCPVESIGGLAGTETLPVGIVLIAKFDEKKKNPKYWKPQKLTRGKGIMEILPHTLPITNKPEFVLKVLDKMTSRAIIIKTIRGSAEDFAEMLIKYLDLNSGREYNLEE